MTEEWRGHDPATCAWCATPVRPGGQDPDRYAFCSECSGTGEIDEHHQCFACNGDGWWDTVLQVPVASVYVPKEVRDR